MLGLINKCRIIRSRLFTPPPWRPSETHTHSSALPHLPLCGSLELFRWYEDDLYLWRNCRVIISFNSHAAHAQTWSPVVRCVCECVCVCVNMVLYLGVEKNVSASIGISDSFDLLRTFGWSQQGNVFFYEAKNWNLSHYQKLRLCFDHVTAQVHWSENRSTQFDPGNTSAITFEQAQCIYWYMCKIDSYANWSFTLILKHQKNKVYLLATSYNVSIMSMWNEWNCHSTREKIMN